MIDNEAQSTETVEAQAKAQQEVDDAVREIDAAIAAGGDASKLQAAKQSIAQSGGAGMSKRQAEEVKREAEKAKETAREEEGKKLMEKTMDMVLPLAVMSALLKEGKELKENDLRLSGGDIPRGALFTDAISSGLGAIGARRNQGQSMPDFA